MRRFTCSGYSNTICRGDRRFATEAVRSVAYAGPDHSYSRIQEERLIAARDTLAPTMASAAFRRPADPIGRRPS